MGTAAGSQHTSQAQNIREKPAPPEGPPPSSNLRLSTAETKKPAPAPRIQQGRLSTAERKKPAPVPRRPFQPPSKESADSPSNDAAGFGRFLQIAKKGNVKLAAQKKVIVRDPVELRREFDASMAPMELMAAATDLGIDVCHETELLWIAEELYYAELPLGWVRLRDTQERLYYYNESMNEARWIHPLDDIFLDAVDFQRQVVREGHFASVEARAKEMYAYEMQVAGKWKRYFDEWGNPFYYHPEECETLYQDPRQKVVQNARARSFFIEEIRRRFPDIPDKLPTPAPTPSESVVSEDPRKSLSPEEILVGEQFARLTLRLLKFERRLKQKVEVSSGICVEKTFGHSDGLRLFTTSPRLRERAAIHIQKHVRGKQDRRRLVGRKVHHAAKMQTAAFIQVHVRKWLPGVRAAHAKKVLAQRRLTSAVQIQRTWRVCKERIRQRKLRKELAEKARKLKAARERERAVRVALKWWGLCHRVDYLRQKKLDDAASVLQQQARVLLARVLMRKMRLLACPVCFKFKVAGSELRDGRPVWRSELWMGPENLSTSPQPLRESQVAALPSHPSAVNLFARDRGFGAGYASFFEILEVVLTRRRGEAFAKWHRFRCNDIARSVKGGVLRAACARAARKQAAAIREQAAAMRVQAAARRFLVARRWRPILTPLLSELRKRRNEAAIVIQKSWRRHVAIGLLKDLREETTWPLKVWCYYSTTMSGRAQVQVKFFPNPRFDVHKHAMSEFGPTMTTLSESIRDMEIEVVACVGKAVPAEDQPWTEARRTPCSGWPPKTDIATLPCRVKPALSTDTVFVQAQRAKKESEMPEVAQPPKIGQQAAHGWESKEAAEVAASQAKKECKAREPGEAVRILRRAEKERKVEREADPLPLEQDNECAEEAASNLDRDPAIEIVHSDLDQLPAIHSESVATGMMDVEAPPRKPAWSAVDSRVDPSAPSAVSEKKLQDHSKLENDVMPGPEKHLGKKDSDKELLEPLAASEKQLLERTSDEQELASNAALVKKRQGSAKRPRSSKRLSSSASGDSSKPGSAGGTFSSSSVTSGFSKSASEILMTVDTAQLVAMATLARPASAASKRPTRNLDPLFGQGLLLQPTKFDGEVSDKGTNFLKHHRTRQPHADPSLSGLPGTTGTRASRFYDAARDNKKRGLLPATRQRAVVEKRSAVRVAASDPSMSSKLLAPKHKSPPKQQSRASRFLDMSRGVHVPQRTTAAAVADKSDSIKLSSMRPSTALSGRASEARSRGSSRGDHRESRAGRSSEIDPALLLDKTIDNALNLGVAADHAEVDSLPLKEQRLTYPLRKRKLSSSDALQSSQSMSTVPQVGELSNDALSDTR